MVAEVILALSTSVIVAEFVIAKAVPFSVKLVEKSLIPIPAVLLSLIIGASLTLETEIVVVAVLELAVPSLTMKVIVRLVVLGLSEMLLYLI